MTTAPQGAWRRDLALIALPALAVFAYCLFDARVFTDGDTNWHIATGRWILAHHLVPTTDPFSYTALGRRWVTQEWLSDVLMALAFRAWGWSGLMLLTAAGAAAAFALIAAALRRWLGTLSVIATLGLVYILLLPHILVRPQIVTLPLLALWPIRLIEARRRDRAPPLWLLPVMALWANLHGDFVYGLAFTAVFALEAFLAAAAADLRSLPPQGEPRGRWRSQAVALLHGAAPLVALRWGAFLFAAAGMTLITPNGVTGLIYPFTVLSLKSLQSIVEWQSASFARLSTLEIDLFFTLFVCLYRGVRVPAVRLGLLLLVLYMTLAHIRQELVLAVVAPLLLAQPLGRAFEPALPADGHAPPWPPVAKAWPPLLATATLVLALAAWRAETPFVHRDALRVPMTALAHVPAPLRARPVFNDYSFGGWLILQGVAPFMDGRSDMYGDDLYGLWRRVNDAEPAAVDQVFARYGVAWTILPPSSPLVARLDTTPGWRRLYADRWAVVHVRSDALPAPSTDSQQQAPPPR